MAAEVDEVDLRTGCSGQRSANVKYSHDVVFSLRVERQDASPVEGDIGGDIEFIHPGCEGEARKIEAAAPTLPLKIVVGSAPPADTEMRLRRANSSADKSSDWE